MKKLLTIIIIAHFATTASAIPATDLNLCVWSYEGIIKYQTALKGCKTGNLDGLSEKQSESFFEMTPEQQKDLQWAFSCQAKNRNFYKCVKKLKLVD